MGSVKMILAIAMAMLVGLLTFGVALADDKGTSYRVTVTNLTKKTGYYATARHQPSK